MNHIRDIDLINTCKEDTYKTDESDFAESVNNIYDDASQIGMKAILFNKDDLPLFMEKVHLENSNFLDYTYDEKIPFITQCVAYALGIKNLCFTTDIEGVEWIHDHYHNIVFDENGRQIGHFNYLGTDKNQVVLYQEPIRPQVYDYLDEEEYDFMEYENSKISNDNKFTPEVEEVIKHYGIIDVKYINDVDDNTWIYSKFNNVILNDSGKQIGHMVFPFSLINVGKAILYETPIDPVLNMI